MHMLTRALVRACVCVRVHMAGATRGVERERQHGAIAGLHGAADGRPCRSHCASPLPLRYATLSGSTDFTDSQNIEKKPVHDG
jgi:hypothetical protein